MASSSDPLDASARLHDYASHTNVSNFVSVKLSGYDNYDLWKAQMLCLMEAHDLRDLVVDGPGDLSLKIMKRYDSLLKGWIFGSVSEDVLRIIVDPTFSAKDVWITLESCFDTTKRSKQDSSPPKSDTKGEMKTQNVGFAETKTNDNVADSEITEKNMDLADAEAESEAESEDEFDPTNSEIKYLTETIYLGGLDKLDYYIEHVTEDFLRKKIDKDGNTVLHIAVGISRNDVVEKVLKHVDNLTTMKSNDGSTVLHIAATVGNIEAVGHLASKDVVLLYTPDNKGRTPLVKAYENLHFRTIKFLVKAIDTVDKKLEAANVEDESKKEGDVGENSNKATGVDAERKEKGRKKKKSSLPPLPDAEVELGVKILVQAISSKEYDFALDLVKLKPQYAVSNDQLLMAMARTFPSGLNYAETLIYPRWGNIPEMMLKITRRFFTGLDTVLSTVKFHVQYNIGEEDFQDTAIFVGWLIIIFPIWMLYLVYTLILLLLLMVCFAIYPFYFLLWKAAAIVAVPPIKSIEQKKKEYEQAKQVLELVCNKIAEMRSRRSSHRLYTKPFFEAARHDAYNVVEEILGKWPEAIRCTDDDGYDIIQLATIHRSVRIYNLVYIIQGRKSIYRTMEDSSKNNMLHLVGRLAPSNKLKRKTGAALQLQRELQWRQEVKKLVFPTYVSKENDSKETPDMVFTKKHENLLNEGEKWMKTVAESSSITAALITTIVFAAAITVPGGSNQETGTPLFLKKIAFTVFAIADAISLFSSTTALLVFLSILTARFAEEDFLVRLPRRLIIGLCTLLLSTTTMMVAFSATLFLVFSDHKTWMLISFATDCIFFYSTRPPYSRSIHVNIHIQVRRH